MRRSVVRYGLAGTIVLVIGIAVCLPRRLGDSAPVRDETRCPDCGTELPSGARASGECPYCKLRNGPSARRSNDPQAQVENPAVKRQTKGSLLFILVGAGVIVGVVGACLVVRWRMIRGRDRRYSFRCPVCARKLGYRRAQSGQMCICPVCKKPCKYPPAGTGWWPVRESTG